MGRSSAMPPDTAAVAEQVEKRTPTHLRLLFDRATDHNLLMLGAGLAFFGILSIGPAIGIVFGLMQLVTGPEASDRLVELLQNSFPEQLGLAELLEQAQDRGGRYAGIGLLVLLWPATTLASGWTRALDDIEGNESTGAVRGLAGRLRGLVPGAILIGAMLAAFIAVTFGTALVGEDGAALVIVLVIGTIVVQAAFNLAILRWLPSEHRPWHHLWPGALWATGGVLLSTIGLAVALSLGENLTQQYPPSLITSIVLGLWLYGANTSLLLGAEHNAIRHERGGEPDIAEDP
jgi:membrane protein